MAMYVNYNSAKLAKIIGDVERTKGDKLRELKLHKGKDFNIQREYLGEKEEII